MTTFDDREKAFENKFAHDAELKFRATARRNKLLGLWAADLLGHRDEAAEAYAQTVIIADLDEPGDDDVLAKLATDLEGMVERAAIRDKMMELMMQVAEDLPQTDT
ncbi:DUF1476 domain-containing protein [Ruegeria sp. TM1040]|jgi:hypothetical protein|uniref:DUF1476 domain-containing protein n=1 Tax=Rhodobacterales TaxID=204455 RepID=UPI0000554C93|nr:DUF1476 domain-containing protein [Ruegeria sp. TM1040]ABF64199.1 protein of unknown function DUF1476 [Ruegeria sp. TM1040]MDF9302895.1 DUF1476 domain-containing protein [Tritonibacter mobilis]